MKPSEFREGLAKAINDSAEVWLAQLEAGTWLGDCHTYQAAAVIAYLETADLIYIENAEGELIGWPLADWLKEAK